VFLWRADKFGALNMSDEHQRVVKLVRGFTATLQSAAGNEYHIGRRYSRLLENLWFPGHGLTSEMVDGNVKCATNSLATNQPKTLEILSNTELEAHRSILQTIGLDPFCGSFSGFEADFLEFGLQDGFDFQGLNPNNL
jgi:hypothetical protein